MEVTAILSPSLLTIKPANKDYREGTISKKVIPALGLDDNINL
jgi:hypothetical protein